MVNSSVGAKLIVGITGVCLVLFVIAHLIGNLKLLQGPDAINGYAYFLKHDLGALLWLARGLLLAIFVAHLTLAIRLSIRSRAARPVPYNFANSVQARLASRLMMQTGVVVLAFVIFHIAHFTLGWVKDATVLDDTGRVVTVNCLDLKDDQGRHDVYRMVIAGFRTPWVAVLYILAQGILFVHLRHGIPSTLQTLGLKSERWAGLINGASLLIALFILVGNVGLVLAVWGGFVK